MIFAILGAKVLIIISLSFLDWDSNAFDLGTRGQLILLILRLGSQFLIFIPVLSILELGGGGI